MKYNHTVILILILSMLTLFSGCAITPILPHHSTMPTGEPTAIDGLWQIQGKDTKTIFRIKHGIMYAESNIAPGSFVKQGWVVAKDIKLQQFPKFAVMPITLKQAMWDYGQGEIELISKNHIILRYFPNSRTGFNRTYEETYENLSLDNPSLLSHLFSSPSLSAKSSAIVSENIAMSNPSNIPPTKTSHDNNQYIDFNNKWAVIIGISQYQYAGQNGLTNLIFADDDAISFARSLRNLGWSESHMKLLTNEKATQRNIMIALESWLSKAGPNDQIVLFWAGHGFPDPEDPEKVYFATYDTDIKIPATGYRMDRVRTALEERKSKNVILFADTCHAGKLITRGERGISIVPNITMQSTPKGWVFMVGADTDRQAIEDTSWANGAFTHSLIEGLNGAADGFQSVGPKDGVVTLGELRSYMNTAMPEETQKVLGVAKRPVITTNTGDPDIWNLTLQVSQFK